MLEMEAKEVENLDQSSPLLKALEVLAQAADDQAAWHQLYRSARPFVFATNFRLLHGAHILAEDATQEVFFRLVRYGDFRRFPTENSLKAYLKVMCRHVVSDFTRRLLRGREVAGIEMESVPHLDRSNARLLLLDLQAALGVSDKKLLELLMQGWTTAEISGLLSISY